MKKLLSIFICASSGLAFAQTYTTYYPEVVYFKSNWCPSSYDLERLKRSAPNLYFKSAVRLVNINEKLSCCIDRVILPDGEPRERIIGRFPDGVANKEDTAICSGKTPTEEEALKLLSGELTYAKLKEQQNISFISETETNSKQANLRKSGKNNSCYTGPRGGTYTITSSGRKNYSGC